MMGVGRVARLRSAADAVPAEPGRAPFVRMPSGAGSRAEAKSGLHRTPHQRDAQVTFFVVVSLRLHASRVGLSLASAWPSPRPARRASTAAVDYRALLTGVSA